MPAPGRGGRQVASTPRPSCDDTGQQLQRMRAGSVSSCWCGDTSCERLTRRASRTTGTGSALHSPGVPSTHRATPRPVHVSVNAQEVQGAARGRLRLLDPWGPARASQREHGACVLGAMAANHSRLRGLRVADRSHPSTGRLRPGLRHHKCRCLFRSWLSAICPQLPMVSKVQGQSHVTSRMPNILYGEMW